MMEMWEIGCGLALSGGACIALSLLDVSWFRGLTGSVLLAVGCMIVWSV